MALVTEFDSVIERVECKEKDFWVLKVKPQNLKVGSKRLCDLVEDWLKRKGFTKVDCSEVQWSDVDSEIIIDYKSYGRNKENGERIKELTYLLLNRLGIEYVNISIGDEYVTKDNFKEFQNVFEPCYFEEEYYELDEEELLIEQMVNNIIKKSFEKNKINNDLQ